MQCMCLWNVTHSYHILDQSFDWFKKEDRAISVIHTEDDIIDYLRSFSSTFFAAADVSTCYVSRYRVLQRSYLL